MAKVNLSLALDRYDRHFPFFMQTVKPHPDIELTALEVGMVPPRKHGIDRHGRMLRDAEFDVCELSLSSYIIAKTRGLPFTAVPVFPRRLFSANHIFVNVAAGIAKPADLVGKRVAVWSFQTTMSVLAKGDLKSEYGVSWEQIAWCTMHDEEMPVGEAVRRVIKQLPRGADVGDMLIEGTVDALIHPHPPRRILDGHDNVRRLFSDSQAEAERYYAKYGYDPIMHLLAFRQELLDREPWLGRAVMEMWEDAKQQANGYYDDPSFSQIVSARNDFEAQRRKLGDDPWPSGLAANRANLERFLQYGHDQRLFDAIPPVESLFHQSVHDT